MSQSYVEPSKLLSRGRRQATNGMMEIQEVLGMTGGAIDWAGSIQKVFPWTGSTNLG